MHEVKTERVVPEAALSSSSLLPARRASGLTRRSRKGGWTHEEDASLSRLVKQFDGRNWKKIAEAFPGRTDIQCLHRWQKVLNPELVKGSWTKEEDECIIKLVTKHGSKRWSIIAESLPGRLGKQCRERWHNHLNPAIKKDAWTLEEEVTLIQCHQKYGNKWAEIAKFLPGRAENSVKNHWNCSLKKKLDSYSSYGHQSGIIALNWKDCIRKVGCSEIDPSKQGACGLGTCFRPHNLTTAANAMTLQPRVGGNTRPECFEISKQNMTSEHSRFQNLDVKASPTRKLKLATEANNSSLQLLNLSLDRSSCASAQSPLSCSSNSSSDMLLCYESDALDDLQNDRFTPQLNAHHPSSSKRFDSSDNSRGNSDPHQDRSQRPEVESFGSSSYLTLKMNGTNVSRVRWSTPPPDPSPTPASNPTSPTSFLRTAAKSFKNTPSIMRKRKRDSSKRLFDGVHLVDRSELRLFVNSRSVRSPNPPIILSIACVVHTGDINQINIQPYVKTMQPLI